MQFHLDAFLRKHRPREDVVRLSQYNPELALLQFLVVRTKIFVICHVLIICNSIVIIHCFPHF